MNIQYNAMTAVGFILFVVFLLAVIVFWPFLLIFALNTLFVSLSIPYTFWTWLSVAILQMSTFGGLATILKRIEGKL